MRNMLERRMRHKSEKSILKVHLKQGGKEAINDVVGWGKKRKW